METKGFFHFEIIINSTCFRSIWIPMPTAIINILLSGGDRLVTSEYDVYRRQTMTSKVG